MTRFQHDPVDVSAVSHGALIVVMLLMLFAVLGPARAQSIPPLPDAPVNRSDLEAWRDKLIGERNALHSRVESHNGECSAVEKNSAEDAACISDRARLSAALNRHIKSSNEFIAAVRSVTASGAGPLIRAETRAECVRVAGVWLSKQLDRCGHWNACLANKGARGPELACAAALLIGALSIYGDPSKISTAAVAGLGATFGCATEVQVWVENCKPNFGACEAGLLKQHVQYIENSCPKQ